MTDPDPKRRPSIQLEELSAFASLAWAMMKRRGISRDTLSFVAGFARQEFEAARGVDGLRDLIADRIGGPVPRPQAPGPPGGPTPGPSRQELRGTGLCAGRAKGPARLAVEPIGADHPPAGEVLVCARLDLTTAMELDREAGVVVEAGSVGAAPLRAARSRGIPVVRLLDAISLIPEGAIVTIDGALGQIEIAA